MKFIINTDLISYGPWAIAFINFVGFIYLLIKDIIKSTKISNLKLIIDHLKDNNEIIKNQSTYLKNIDCPIIDFYKSGYLIIENENNYKYDFAIRYLNVGKRPAINFTYTVVIYEKTSNNILSLLNSFTNESVNPVPQQSDIKLGHLVEKEKNNNDLFIKINFSYQDKFDFKTNTGSVYYKMPFIQFNDEKGMFTVNISEKKLIDSHNLI